MLILPFPGMSLATMMRIITEDTAENEETDEATDTEDFRQRLEAPEPPVVDRDARRAMIRTEIMEAAGATVKRTNSKAAKLQQRVDLSKANYQKLDNNQQVEQVLVLAGGDRNAC